MSKKVFLFYFLTFNAIFLGLFIYFYCQARKWAKLAELPEKKDDDKKSDSKS